MVTVINLFVMRDPRTLIERLQVESNIISSFLSSIYNKITVFIDTFDFKINDISVFPHVKPCRNSGKNTDNETNDSADYFSFAHTKDFTLHDLVPVEFLEEGQK